MFDLKYSIPITESANVDTDFIIAGTAINCVTTSNNHKFVAEELRKSAGTLKGVPLLVDHENKVENIKGRVFYSGFDEISSSVPFKAKVMDEMCKAMIKDGRLNSVSVGAIVEDVEEADGALIPRGITFKELSLVAVPADSGATFNIALKEAYDSKKEIKADYTAPNYTTAPKEEGPTNDAGMKEETAEHPWATPDIIKRIVAGHLKDDPEYYNDDEEEEEDEDEGEDEITPELEDKAKLEVETKEVVAEAIKEIQEDITLTQSKGGKKMSEAQEAVDSTKLLMEKLSAMEAKLATLEAAKEVKVEAKIVQEVEEVEASGNQIVEGFKSFTLVREKY